MTLPRIALLLVVLGAGLAALGIAIGPAGFGFEGAYFTRAAGTPAYEGMFSEWSSGAALLSPEDGNLFLGAAIACLALAAGAALAHRAGLRLTRAA